MTRNDKNTFWRTLIEKKSKRLYKMMKINHQLDTEFSDEIKMLTKTKPLERSAIQKVLELSLSTVYIKNTLLS